MSDYNFIIKNKKKSNIFPTNKKSSNILIRDFNLNKRINTNNIYKIKLNKNNNRYYNKINNKTHLNNILGKLSFLLFINFIQMLSNNQLLLLSFNYSKITLKIKGIGFSNILGRALGYLIESGDCSFKNQDYPNEIFINGIEQKIVNYSYYFNETYNLVELIWYNTIKDCSCMFHACFNITEIDLSFFNSSAVTNMYRMFFCCISLTSINFNNFNTSRVTNMRSLFSNCSSLISLNLSDFDTSQVLYMNHMFFNCSSLISLNLSHFNTSNTRDLRRLVGNCISLTSINLSNFDISKVTWINQMFEGCINLEYINLKNFKENNLTSYSSIFSNVPDNVVVCIEINSQSKIFSQLQNKKCLTLDCSSSNWKLNQKKIINESGSCIDNCENNLQYKYEYNNKCYKDCPNGIFENNKCKCELEKCLICPQVALNYELCSKCNYNYYQKENDESNIGEYFNCYQNIKGFYLDKDNSIFKKCYYTCEECVIKGDNITHYCLKCNEEFPIGFYFNNFTNCYINCSYYYFFDEDNNYYCTLNNSCPKEFPKLLKDKNECIKNDIKNLIEDIIKFEKNETKEDNIEQKEEEIKYYDTIIEEIERAFTENYDTKNLDSGKDEVVETEKIKITFTSTENQKNNQNNNETKINLGDCETLLRNYYKQYYNISRNQTLYIKKLDIIQDNMNIPKIEYDVYAKLSGHNLQKLNLSICKEAKIELSVPIIITESLDKLNSSSGYYNDICYTSTTESGTDIILKDRKNEFIEGNKIVCQDDCIFSDYDYNSQKAICLCDVKQSSNSFLDMNINKTKLYENFIDLKNIANIKLMVCYKELFNKKSIINNIACFSIIPIIIFHFITFIIFYKSQKLIIKNKINDISFGIKNWDLVKEEERKETQNNKKENKNKKMAHNKRLNNKNTKIKLFQNKKKDDKNKKNDNIIKIPNPIDYYYGTQILKIENPPIKKREDLKINVNNRNNNNIRINNNKRYKSSNIRIVNNNIEKEETIKKAKEIMIYNDEEKNNLSYELALKYDKRTYCEYYISLLKTKHILFFSFYYNNDYNSKIIKIDLFFINFAIYYTVNALFFNDNTMHKIYEDKGSFNFNYQLPQIIYSTLISSVLNILLKLLALSEGNILDYKKNKDKKDLNKREEELFEKLSIKFILFFTISFLFLLFFWYYLSIFGAIYKNTQYHLIKDTLISFGLSLLYPFGIYLLPGFFRISALSNKNNKKSYLYNLSKFFQML